MAKKHGRFLWREYLEHSPVMRKKGSPIIPKSPNAYAPFRVSDDPRRDRQALEKSLQRAGATQSFIDSVRDLEEEEPRIPRKALDAVGTKLRDAGASASFTDAVKSEIPFKLGFADAFSTILDEAPKKAEIRTRLDTIRKVSTNLGNLISDLDPLTYSHLLEGNRSCHDKTDERPISEIAMDLEALEKSSAMALQILQDSDSVKNRGDTRMYIMIHYLADVWMSTLGKGPECLTLDGERAKSKFIDMAFPLLCAAKFTTDRVTVSHVTRQIREGLLV